MGNEGIGTAQGVTAGDAAQHNTGAAHTAAGIGPEEAPAAGVQDTDAMNREFEELIKGKYKAQYDARMQDTIQKRIRGLKEAADSWKEAAPLMEMLGKKYGIDAADTRALADALKSDGAKARPPQAVADRRIREQADRLHAAWQQQEAATRQVYPDFQMEKELGNPAFVKLITGDVDVQTAYEVVHRDELIPAAMQYAARAMEQNLAKRIAANGFRPAENGMDSAAAAVVRTDVSKFTRADVDEVARRVARGERVSFG